MLTFVLLMFAAGIGVSLAATDPREVTLRWLRLGDILAIAFIAVGVALGWWDRGSDEFGLRTFGMMLALPFILQLMAVQLGWRRIQRVVGIGATLLLLTFLSAVFCLSIGHEPSTYEITAVTQAVLLSSGLLGGFLMAMLLGHAYLTAGNEMTQAPFRRLVFLLGALLILRGLFSLVFALWPYRHWAEDVVSGDRLMNTVMLWARYLVGIVTPLIFTWMTYDCVKRRANQSATGILYVTIVLVILGEGAALALLRSTGLPF
jgi:hypothetical protein